MGLVDDDEIPPGFDDRPGPELVVLGDALGRPAAARPDRLHGIEGADNLVERSPRVDAGVDWHASLPDEDKLLAEAVRHLSDPLELDAFGRHDEHTMDETARLELADDEAGLDRLAEADLVGQEQA